jgi:hypothetical protein
MTTEPVIQIKLQGPADLVQEVTDKLTYDYKVLTNSGSRRNDRDPGVHLFLTITRKEARP